jgi:hypothetical protein
MNRFVYLGSCQKWHINVLTEALVAELVDALS